MRLSFACVLLVTGDALAKPCVIESKSVEPVHLHVQAKGGPRLHVRIAGVPATVKIADPETGPPQPIAVEVHGALAFSATIAPEKIALTPKSKIDSSNGMLRLQPGSGQLVGVRARGRLVEGDLLLEGIRFKGVLLACEEVTLDAVESPTPGGEPRGELFVPKASPFKLWTNPGGGPTMDVVLEHPTDLELSRHEKSGAFVRVTARFSRGSLLQAWAKASELQKPPHRELQDLPTMPPACSRVPEARNGLQLAAVTVAAGTPISADRLFPWATARGGDPVTVLFKPGESWVQLVLVPGITSTTDCEASTVLDEAWVPRAAVKFAGQSPDGGVK